MTTFECEVSAPDCISEDEYEKRDKIIRRRASKRAKEFFAKASKKDLLKIIEEKFSDEVESHREYSDENW
jgi:hypothetical protein